MKIDLLTFFWGGKWNNTHCISINKSLFGEKNTTEANSLVWLGMVICRTYICLEVSHCIWPSLMLERRNRVSIHLKRLGHGIWIEGSSTTCIIYDLLAPPLGPCLFPKWRLTHGSLVMSSLQIKIPWKSVWYKQLQRTHVTTGPPGRSWRGWGWRV